MGKESELKNIIFKIWIAKEKKANDYKKLSFLFSPKLGIDTF